MMKIKWSAEETRASYCNGQRNGDEVIKTKLHVHKRL